MQIHELSHFCTLNSWKFVCDLKSSWLPMLQLQLLLPWELEVANYMTFQFSGVSGSQKQQLFT